MIRGLIFDLDMSLIDTSSLYQLRAQSKWNSIYTKLNYTKIFNGISNLLALAKTNYQLGVVTTSPRKYAEKMIQHHQLDIPVLSGYHDTIKHKPHPEPILNGAHQLRLSPDSVVYIGDEISDLLAAKAAKCLPVAVTWGLGDKQDLKQHSPDFLAENVNQLKQYLKLVEQ
jgi:HAD superfamily hydrolase (TIGR01549 family)|tara:strand:- start:208 stop:717 length:510 start_codon:yes stop_codon:yes gene_type:complete